jgi:hypothetical protein
MFSCTPLFSITLTLSRRERVRVVALRTLREPQGGYVNHKGGYVDDKGGCTTADRSIR